MARKFVLRNIRDKEHWAIFRRSYCGIESGKRCYCLTLLAEIDTMTSEITDKQFGRRLVQLMNNDPILNKKIS